MSIYSFSINFEGILVSITLKPIKNLYLRINPLNGQVTINAPLEFKLALIQQFLWHKKRWIFRQQEKIANKILASNELNNNNCYLPFMGQNYLIEWDQSKNDHLFLFENDKFLISESMKLNDQQRINHLIRWYRQQIRKQITSLIAHWENQIGVKAESVNFKRMKRRWGSCNTRTKTIWLNLYLIQTPLACLEYVLVHELVHLIEKNHSARFYLLMDHFLPSWRQTKIELERAPLFNLDNVK